MDSWKSCLTDFFCAFFWGDNACVIPDFFVLL